MTKTNSTILDIMNVLFWMAFVGLSINAAAMLISFGVTLFSGIDAAKNLYMTDSNLFALYEQNKLHYIQIVSLMVVLMILKAHIAYLVVQIFYTFNFNRPFTAKVTKLVSAISDTAVAAGILAIIGEQYCERLTNRGATIPVDWSAGEILFFAGVLYIIAQVFKRGTELQVENDLTV